ncbi:MAG: O-methyltransferase [Muribaculaceae bacterium]|nr:O-methyltransferase [Muribaculaceae bacterium]
MEQQIDDYILDHISPEPRLLKQLNRHTNAQHLYGRMCSGHLQGRILKMLTSMIKPTRILELGTFTGYSALCFAEGIEPDCHIDTIEIDDEIAEVAQEWFDKSPDGQKITLYVGDALHLIPNLPGEYDLVFIDANKRIYSEYLDAVYSKLKPGGYIFADNTLWDGKVLDPEATDPQTSGIKKFNDSISTDSRFETVILPLRDGLTIMRKL